MATFKSAPVAEAKSFQTRKSAEACKVQAGRTAPVALQQNESGNAPGNCCVCNRTPGNGLLSRKNRLA